MPIPAIICLLLALGLDGVIESWHWRRLEPMRPDYFHPTIFCRNALFGVGAVLGGISLFQLVGIGLFGSLVIRESAINIMGRGCIPWEKQSLLGIPRYPWVEMMVAGPVGLYLIIGA